MINRFIQITPCNTVGRLGVVALVGAGLAVLSVPTAARAQMSSEMAEKIAAMGRVVDPPNTAKLYTPLQEKEPYAYVKINRDVKYGPHERNVVDIFADDSNFTGRPVFMFVHGGAYIGGIKRAPGSAFYDNIMVFAARHGMVGVNVEYRLAPEFPWPAAAQDLAAAVRFVADNISRYGGDGSQIYLMGHSAGATHAATYVSHPEFHGPNGSGLKGAIFSSAIYDFIKNPPSEGGLAYFGKDPALYAERSSLAGLVKSKVPFMMSTAELDPPVFGEQFALLKEAMCKSERGCVRGIVLAKHSHMSESYAINTSDTQFSSQIVEFIKTGK
jgi:acetyl esterase/lipase